MLTNLTEKQVAMLNTMWSLDSIEDLWAWQNSLTEEDRKLSVALQELILIDAIDECIEDMDMHEALEVITNIKNTLH